MTKGYTKVCSTCKAEKMLAEFYARKDGKDGLQAQCRICANARTLAWARKHPEKTREKERRRWEKTPIERSREVNAQWREKNPEKYKELQKRKDAKRRASLAFDHIDLEAPSPEVPPTPPPWVKKNTK